MRSANLNTVFNFSAATGTFTLDADGGTDAVTVNGTSGADTIAVVKGATTTVQVGALKTVSLPSGTNEEVTVFSGDGDDTINVTGTTNSNQIINLQGGDPKHALDFRRVYATVLDRWLNCPGEKVLGENFAPLPVLAKPE